MYLHVFQGNPKRGNLLCIETNIEFAVKYWTKRKEKNENINWVLSSSPKLSSYNLG